jgi:CxxC-x17-CxxC domain-containing protein
MKNFGNDRGFKNFSNRSFGGGNRGRSFGGGNRGGFDRNREDRQMFSAICDKCGAECELPFKPTGEKPVYCSNCFEKTSGRDGGNRDFGGNNRRFDSRDTKDYRQDNTRSEIQALDKKLDRIIELLMTQKPVVTAEKKVKKTKKVEAPVETQE